MGSLETEVISAWARQGSEVERHATVDMLYLLGAFTETTARCPGLTTEQEGWSGQAGGLSTEGGHRVSQGRMLGHEGVS